MLAYTSICMIINVIYSFYKNDRLMHHIWLLLVCTSIFHHANNYENKFIEKCDIFIVHLVTAIHLSTTIVSLYNKFLIYNSLLNILILYLIYFIYYKVPNRSNLQHSILHLSGIIAGCNTIYIRNYS